MGFRIHRRLIVIRALVPLQRKPRRATEPGKAAGERRCRKLALEQWGDGRKARCHDGDTRFDVGPDVIPGIGTCIAFSKMDTFIIV